MEDAKYTSLLGEYRLIRISIDEILSDVQRVKDSLESDDDELFDEVKYIDRMTKAVETGFAIRSIKNGVDTGFIYINQPNNREAEGATILFKDEVDSFICVARYLITMYPKLKRVRMYPHKSNLKYLVSIATGTSLLDYHSGAPYIKIGLSRLKGLLARYNKYIGLRQCQQ